MSFPYPATPEPSPQPCADLNRLREILASAKTEAQLQVDRPVLLAQFYATVLGNIEDWLEHNDPGD